MKKAYEEDGMICIQTDDLRLVEDILERLTLYIEDQAKHLEYNKALENIRFYKNLEQLFDIRQKGEIHEQHRTS